MSNHPMYRPHLNEPKRVNLARRQDSLPVYSKATARQRGSAPPGPSAKPPGTVPPARYDRVHGPIYRPTPEPHRPPIWEIPYRNRQLPPMPWPPKPIREAQHDARH